MLPIYTRYLTPEDYGVLELLTMAIEIVGILIGLRISQAMFRFYILAETQAEKQIIISTVYFTVLMTSFAGSLFLYFASEGLSQLIFGNLQYIYEFQLFAFTLIANAISAVGLSYIRARRMPILFVSIGVATLLLQVIMNIIFVVVLEMHVTGVVLSALISGAIVAVSLSVYILLNVGIGYSRAVAVKVISFVAPLILASIGAFYVSYADKYFLRLFGSLTEVGLYALAARVSSILGTINLSFNMSWMADRFEVVKKENARQIYQQVFRFMSAILVLTGVGLAIFANDFFRIMTDPAFYSAGNLVPILVLAVITQSYTTFCNFGIMLEKKTKYIAEASWYKAIVSTIGYIILIPYIGLYGAAITLVISNIFELFLINKRASRLYDMELMWAPVGIMMALGLVFVSATYAFPSGELNYFCIRLVLFSSFVGMVYFLPIWQDEDKNIMRAVASKVMRTKKV